MSHTLDSKAFRTHSPQSRMPRWARCAVMTSNTLASDTCGFYNPHSSLWKGTSVGGNSFYLRACTYIDIPIWVSMFVYTCACVCVSVSVNIHTQNLADRHLKLEGASKRVSNTSRRRKRHDKARHGPTLMLTFTRCRKHCDMYIRTRLYVCVYACTFKRMNLCM